MNDVVKRVLETLAVSIFYTVWFVLVSNGLIRFALQEDVARNCGPSMMRKVIQTAAVFLLAEILLSALSQENEKASLYTIHHQYSSIPI